MNKRKYYAFYPIFSPAFAVMRIAGKKIEEYAKQYLGGRMLDAGCGDRRKRYLVRRYVKEYVGMDIKKKKVDVAGTLYSLPFKEGSFDSVLCTSVLEHLNKPEKALREIYRVLRHGGNAVFTVPLFWHLHEEPHDYYRFTRYALENIFKDAGFEINKIEPLSGFWTTFLCEFLYYLRETLGGKNPVYCVFALFLNPLIMLLHPFDRSFRFTWLYIVSVRKP
ncbi:hypothetical protein DRQ18_07220 [bacterium]|nr:MAG: hypothetical protein DRQ18_07220 [bacterium]